MPIFHSPWTCVPDKLCQNNSIKIIQWTQTSVLPSSRDFQQRQEGKAPFPEVPPREKPARAG